MVVSSAGQVNQQILEPPGLEPEAMHLTNLRSREAVIGRTAANVADHMIAASGELNPARRAQPNLVFVVVLEPLEAEPTARVLVAGVPDLAGHLFATGLCPLLGTLEEQMVLFRLLDEAVSDDVTMRIGTENAAEGFKSTSPVTAGYSVDSERAASFRAAGPTHMGYPSVIASVRTVAWCVSRIPTED